MINNLLRRAMENYDFARHLYWSIMADGCIPDLCVIEGLPDDEEARSEAVALLVLASCECLATGESSVSFTPEEGVEATEAFKAMMLLDRQADIGFLELDWSTIDENGLPAVKISIENIKAQADYFGIPFNEESLWQVTDQLMTIYKQAERSK